MKKEGITIDHMQLLTRDIILFLALTEYKTISVLIEEQYGKKNALGNVIIFRERLLRTMAYAIGKNQCRL